MRMNRIEPEAIRGRHEAMTDGGATPTVVPMRHDENRGVGGAIKTGYREAMSDDVDVVAVMNGDGQMDPAVLDRILDPVVEGKAAYAKGNRLLSSDHWDGMSRWRLFGNVILTGLTRIASGYWRMTDPQNGYTAISVDALQQLNLDAMYERYGFLNDMLIRLNVHDMRVADVEMSAVYGDESSSIQYTEFVPRLSWLLLLGFVWRLRKRYASGERLVAVPYLAGVLGGPLFLASLAVSLPVLDGGLTRSESVVGLVACVLLIATGIVMERQRSERLETTVRK
jgi:glycosyltransferase involved in cell wall biosynthesis